MKVVRNSRERQRNRVVDPCCDFLTLTTAGLRREEVDGEIDTGAADTLTISRQPPEAGQLDCNLDIDFEL
jgi:hypothetical protein